MCVHLCVCVLVWVFACVCVFAIVCLLVCVHLCVCVLVCMCVCHCMFACVRASLCMCVYASVCAPQCLRSCVRACVSVCLCVSILLLQPSPVCLRILCEWLAPSLVRPPSMRHVKGFTVQGPVKVTPLVRDAYEESAICHASGRPELQPCACHMMLLEFLSTCVCMPVKFDATCWAMSLVACNLEHWSL